MSPATNRFSLVLQNAKKALRVRQLAPIVCHDLKLVYYPIPKVASSSIKAFLIRHAPNIIDPHLADELRTTTEHNLIHSIVFPTMPLNEASRLKGYLHFAVVRNPYDRIDSCYRDKIQKVYATEGIIHPGLERYNRILGRKVFHYDMSFSEFLHRISCIPDAIADEHFRSQYRFLPRVGMSIRLDHVIQIEHLTEQMNQLLASSGTKVKFDTQLNRSANESSSGKPWESRDLLRFNRRYTQDLALLQYPAADV